MKVVVTGGAGFIGGNLCRGLAAAPGVDEVIALDDLSTGLAANLHGVDARLVEGDLVDPEVLDAVLPGTTCIVHLGARPSVPRSLVPHRGRTGASADTAHRPRWPARCASSG